jgi:RNA polymerase sigma-70 factor, ECF subfamily
MPVACSHSEYAGAAFERPAAPQTSSDEVLIRRIAQGDQLAMRTLFARHRLPVYRFVLRIVRDGTLAEDVLSDTFLAVWRQAAGFEARASVSTWLMAIARFKALSAVRRRRTEVELDEDVGAGVIDPADNPEVVLQKKHRDETLRHRIAALAPEHAQVIDLVYYHGKSIAEVAHIVGIPEGTVKTRMFYARRRLAEVVEAA